MHTGLPPGIRLRGKSRLLERRNGFARRLLAFVRTEKLAIRWREGNIEIAPESHV